MAESQPINESVRQAANESLLKTIFGEAVLENTASGTVISGVVNHAEDPVVCEVVVPGVGMVQPKSTRLSAKQVLRKSAIGLMESRAEVAKIRSQEPKWLPNLFNKVFREKVG